MKDRQSYETEIKMLRQAIKTLMYIVSEYMGKCTETDQWGQRLDFGAEMSAVRQALKQSDSFRDSWESNED